MSDLSFHTYRKLADPAQRRDFSAQMEAKGYYAFFVFTEQFRETLKAFDDSDKNEIGELLKRARADFPNPGQFSPSWSTLWDEFDMIFAAKMEAMSNIPLSERDGEWEILIDNPYLSRQIVCYPGLRFTEAAYLFAYFQRELKPNEYLRLQKVTLWQVKTGSREASMLPDT
jgi:hypothetical protein